MWKNLLKALKFAWKHRDKIDAVIAILEAERSLRGRSDVGGYVGGSPDD